MPGKAEVVTVGGDVYRLAWPCGIEAEVERISEHRDELTAEVTIRSSRAPDPGLLHSARVNLMSTRARADVARALAQRDGELDWSALIEQMCFLVRERYREGEPTIDIRTHERAAQARHLVEPFIDRVGATTLAAHGGSGKTTIATAIAVTAATGTPVLGRLHTAPTPVLYCDWETDADTFQQVLDAILVGATIRERPAIFYRHMVGSLHESAAALRRVVARTGAGLVVCDSLGFARGGEPENAEATLRAFTAARSLGVPVLFTDHVTNVEAQGEAKKPFGSAYTWNASRVVWTMDKVQDEGEDIITVALVNRKRNTGRLTPRLGLRLEFDNAADPCEKCVAAESHQCRACPRKPEAELRSIRLKRADIVDVPGLAERLSLKQRILAELRSGPQRQVDVAEALGVSGKQVAARVGDMLKRGDLIQLPDRRIALRRGA